MLTSRNTGFTLIELLVTIAVMSITVTIAVPAVTSFVSNNTLSAVTNSLVSDLSLARTEAITRAVSISLCPSTTASSCTNTDWRLGRIVFVDNNSSGHVDSGDTVLKVAKALSASTVTLTATGFSGSGYVQYSGTGTSANGAGAFTVCSKGVAGRQVSISTTGRVSTVSGVACP